MPELQVVRIAAAILAACNMNYGSAAPVIGVAPATLRHMLLTEKLPKRLGARRAIERFAELNEHVRSRSELRFVDIA